MTMRHSNARAFQDPSGDKNCVTICGLCQKFFVLHDTDHQTIVRFNEIVYSVDVVGFAPCAEHASAHSSEHHVESFPIL